MKTLVFRHLSKTFVVLSGFSESADGGMMVNGVIVKKIDMRV